MSSSEGFLRQRKTVGASSSSSLQQATVAESSGANSDHDKSQKEEVVWGKTPGGVGS